MANSHDRLQLEHKDALRDYTKPSQVQVHQLLCSELSSVGEGSHLWAVFFECTQ